MAEQQYGTKETEDVLDLAFSVKVAYDAADEDGKINANDLFHLIGPAQKVGPAVEGANMIPKELTELSDEEIAALEAKYGPKLNDPDYLELFRGTAIQVRAIKKIASRGKAANIAETEV